MQAQFRSRLGRARKWLGNCLVILFVLLVALAVVGVASGRYQIQPVLSGSMRPGLPVGGVVVTEKIPLSELRVRDVLLFHPPDGPDEFVVHRVIELTPGEAGPVVRTQGDANDTPDSWTLTLQGTTAHRAILSLPWIGYVAVWVHGPLGRKLMMIAGGLLVLLAAAGGLVRTRRARTAEAPPAPDPVPPAGDAVPGVGDAVPTARESRSWWDEVSPVARSDTPGASASELVAVPERVVVPERGVVTQRGSAPQRVVAPLRVAVAERVVVAEQVAVTGDLAQRSGAIAVGDRLPPSLGAGQTRRAVHRSGGGPTGRRRRRTEGPRRPTGSPRRLAEDLRRLAEGLRRRAQQLWPPEVAGTCAHRRAPVRPDRQADAARVAAGGPRTRRPSVP